MKNKDKLIIGIFLTILLIIGAFGGYAISTNHKEQKAQREYEQTLVDTLKGIKEFGDGIDKAKSRLK